MARSAPILALFLAAALAPSPAPAQAPAPSPYAPQGEQRGSLQPRGSFQGGHDGFYLNFMLGYGGLASKGTIPEGSALDSPGTLKMSGSGASFGIAAGGSISPGSIIAVHVFGLSASSFKLDSPSLSGTGRDGASLTLSGFGPSLVFYGMPSNAFIQLTPAITRITLDSGTGLSDSSDRGLGLYLGIGGEWMLAPKWGLGLVGYTMLSSNKIVDTTVRSATFGAALSLTMN